MAINPNFVFADPALQREVVSMAQVQAAVDAARAQQMAELSRQRQAGPDREERRAIREGEIRRQEGAAAENRRQFDESIRFNREALTSQEKIGGVRTKDAEDKELYSNLLSLIEKGDDPPTASELEARMTGLTDARRQALRERRLLRVNDLKRDFGLIADEARRLNAKLQASEKDPRTGIELSADALLGRSQFKNSLGIDPDTGFLRVLIRPPREDGAPTPVQPAPDRVGAIRGFIERRMAGASAPAESIQTIIGRNRGGLGGAAMGFVPMTPPLEDVRDVFQPRGLPFSPAPQPSEIMMPYEGSFMNPTPQSQPWVPARLPFVPLE